MNEFRDAELQASDNQGDMQMPLSMMTGESNDVGLGFDSAFAEKKSAVSGSMLLLLLVVVGVGVLAAMRMTGGVLQPDQSVAAAEIKIDQALRKLTGPESKTADNIDALFRDTESVITVFANDPSKKQVAVDQLQKNPFELFLVQKKKDGADSSEADVIDKLKAEKLKKLKTELADLKVQSLLNGRTSLAVINGQVVREGEQIGSFTVTTISPYGVRLTAEGNTYTLTMEKVNKN